MMREHDRVSRSFTWSSTLRTDAVASGCASIVGCASWRTRARSRSQDRAALPCTHMGGTPVMGLVEIAARLGVSKSRARQLADSKDFPNGWKLSMGKVWMTTDVEAWIGRRF